MINILLYSYGPTINIREDDFFYTPVISYEYRSSPDSEFVTGEFVVNNLLYDYNQTYTIYFIINNVYQIKNISVKIREDYITTNIEDNIYMLIDNYNLLILFFKNSTNFNNSSNNNFALTNTVNQISNMSIYNDPFNNNKSNCYMLMQNILTNDGNINIDNNTIIGGFIIDDIGIGQFDNTNISDYFYTNYNFNNELKIVQYLTFVNINLPYFQINLFAEAHSLYNISIMTGRVNFDKFVYIFNNSISQSYKYDLFLPCFNTGITTTDIYGVNYVEFYLNIFRTTYIPESSSITNNYINLRSVSDNVTQSITTPSNMSQCINNSMSFAHFKVENLITGFYRETTQILPLSRYIQSNTTINFNSNIDPSVLSFNSTTNIFTLNGVFAVFATAETYQMYNNYDILVNTGYSLVIKIGFSSSGPFFFTKIASLFNSFSDYSYVSSDFSMINALEGITSELYINNICDNVEAENANEIGIENLELFFLQLS